MIDLYAMVSPNVQKIYLMLEETGLAYTPHQVNIWKGEQFRPEFLALNPNAKVPVIVDGEGPEGRPYTVFESGAILIYLAEKTGRFLPREGIARHDTLQWLMVQLTGLGPMLGQFNHFCRFASDNAYAVSRYTTEAARLYRLVDDRLGRSRYLGGEAYSIADMATFPWFRTEARLFGQTHPFMGVGSAEHPNLWRWFDEIAARPAVEKALEVIDRHPSTLATATTDEVDRVFGRGQYARRS
ncbi:glutathione S-transferase N-terminal domain-containing protein [Ollibium composti]|uniref:Glutathione S-transferase family protein n=1 Tax=Ollibium composti TaxID=2675109 RepID=A0ABY2Q3L7_9HYPH|nr:glutathione S-transferase N-terminal domain-containing protein [Mesorhizobium composti]THF55300.1 glutathione S-transferase family protein [Mesorhizobium composti]